MQKYIFLIIGLTFFFYNLSAQPGGDLEGDKVDVVKTFEAQLEETSKVDLAPQLPPIDTSTKDQIFSIPVKNFAMEYPAPRIRPLSMKPVKFMDAYNAYLKAGAGLPGTFYGEGSFNKFIDKKYEIGGQIKHHSANFSNDEVENQRFRDTEVGLGGTYFFPQGFALKGKLGFESDKVHYYGYNFDPSLTDTIDVDKDDVKQVFNTFDIGLDFFNSVKLAGDINYNVGIDYYSLNDNFSAGEDGFALDIRGTKWIEGKHSFDLGIRTDYTTYKDTMTQKLNNIYFQPSFTFHGDRFSAKVGANLVNSDDEFRFYPDAEVAVNIIRSDLSVFVGAKGDLQKNTFKSLSDYNPYVVSRSPGMTIQNTSYYKYYAGVKGNIKIFEYRAEVGFKQADNLALFLLDENDPSLRRRFNVLYDTVDIINIGGTIRANIIKNLDVVGTFGYNVYDTKNQERAWHLPALEINGMVTYLTMEDKLRLKASVFVENGVPIPSTTTEKESLNSLFDLSLGAEYWLVDNFGLFAEVNNILDNERQRWQYYPTYGINFLIGATARF
ncbi:MAG: hypothetical protein ACI9XO_002441 [Paraglaciecola sp.]|jgi:hypothetical protein